MNERIIPGKSENSVVVALILCLILAASLVLRLWGNDFGLPYTYHQDGARNVERSLRLLEGTFSYDVNPGWNILMYLEFKLIHTLGSSLGVFGSIEEFVAEARRDPTLVQQAARSLSGLLGTATVLICFFIGYRAYGLKIGLVASLFMGMAFLHVRDSHYAVADVPATFLIAAATLFILNALERRGKLWFFLAGFTSGLASATKWTSMVLLLPVILAVVLTHPRSQWRSFVLRVVRDHDVYSALAGFALGFLLLSPQLLIDPLELVLSGMRVQAGFTFAGLYVDTVPGWVFYLKTLTWGLGIPMLLVSIAGIGWAIHRRSKQDLLLLAFPLTYFLLMGAPLHYFARYALPLIPFMTIFAARALVELVVKMPLRASWQQNGLITASALALVLLPIRSSILHNRLLTQTDTRTLAGDWFDLSVPTGAKIAAEIHTPFFRDQVGAGGPPLPRRGEDRYEIIEINWSRPEHYQFDRYVQQEVDYIVTSSFITTLRFVDESQTAIRQSFYEELDLKAELVVEFKPYDSYPAPPSMWDQMYGPTIALDRFQRPGPTVKIYRVRP